MCKPKSEGGQRCFAHAWKRFEAAQAMRMRVSLSSPDRADAEALVYSRMVELASTPKGAEYVKGLRDDRQDSSVDSFNAALHDYYESALRQGAELAERNRALGGLNRDEKIDRLRSRGSRIAKAFAPVVGSVYATGHVIASSGSLAASIVAGASTVLLTAIAAYRVRSNDPYMSPREREMYAALRKEKDAEVVAERRAAPATGDHRSSEHASVAEDYLALRRMESTPTPAVRRASPSTEVPSAEKQQQINSRVQAIRADMGRYSPVEIVAARAFLNENKKSMSKSDYRALYRSLGERKEALRGRPTAEALAEVRAAARA